VDDDEAEERRVSAKSRKQGTILNKFKEKTGIQNEGNGGRSSGEEKEIGRREEQRPRQRCHCRITHPSLLSTLFYMKRQGEKAEEQRGGEEKRRMREARGRENQVKINRSIRSTQSERAQRAPYSA